MLARTQTFMVEIFPGKKKERERERERERENKNPGLSRNGPLVKGCAGLRYFNSSVVCMGSKVTLSMVYAFN